MNFTSNIFLISLLLTSFAVMACMRGMRTFSLGTKGDRMVVSLPEGILNNYEQSGEDLDHRVREFLLSLHSLSSIKRDSVEVVDWYDEEGNIIMPLPREFIHHYNLLHKGIGCLILSNSGEAFVHMRSKSKRTWPGLYDSLIGGINIVGQSSTQTLARELNEEVGLDITQEPVPNISFLGQCRIATVQNHCIVDTYVVKLHDSRKLSFTDGEVEWGKWVPIMELKDMIDNNEGSFVPSGLQAWRFIESLGVF